ncbi:hypothetical protein DFH09DRAFT_911387 [Mycena vulgaris]|nr:hypothetical protein DFH09DRAFT_911387 [Mycena vulgaris]
MAVLLTPPPVRSCAVALPRLVRSKSSHRPCLISPHCTALLIWDHVITFGAEVNKFWSRKFSGATVLYALLRYGTLFEKITVLFLASWYLTPHVCHPDLQPFTIESETTPGVGSPSSTDYIRLTWL